MEAFKEFHTKFTVEEMLELYNKVIKLSSYNPNQEITDFGKMILSPIRMDNNPTFSLSEYDGKVFWKDWGRSEGGDIINLYLEMFPEKTSFEALKELYELGEKQMPRSGINYSREEKERYNKEKAKRNRRQEIYKIYKKILKENLIKDIGEYNKNKEYEEYERKGGAGREYRNKNIEKVENPYYYLNGFKYLKEKKELNDYDLEDLDIGVSRKSDLDRLIKELMKTLDSNIKEVEEELIEYDLAYKTENGVKISFSNRIMFTLNNERGEISGFFGRIIEPGEISEKDFLGDTNAKKFYQELINKIKIQEGETRPKIPKYLYQKGIKKRECLFNPFLGITKFEKQKKQLMIESEKIKKENKKLKSEGKALKEVPKEIENFTPYLVLVTEGVFDNIKMNANISKAVANLDCVTLPGFNLSQSQASQLKKFGRKLNNSGQISYGIFCDGSKDSLKKAKMLSKKFTKEKLPNHIVISKEKEMKMEEWIDDIKEKIAKDRMITLRSLNFLSLEEAIYEDCKEAINSSNIEKSYYGKEKFLMEISEKISESDLLGKQKALDYAGEKLGISREQLSSIYGEEFFIANELTKNLDTSILKGNIEERIIEEIKEKVKRDIRLEQKDYENLKYEPENQREEIGLEFLRYFLKEQDFSEKNEKKKLNLLGKVEYKELYLKAKNKEINFNEAMFIKEEIGKTKSLNELKKLSQKLKETGKEQL